MLLCGVYILLLPDVLAFMAMVFSAYAAYRAINGKT